jgi:F0F1-type ATP synthase membrane subunit b/b'
MDNDKALSHLLKIEAEAAALVNDAQVEADRRIAESEKQNRAVYEERYRLEAEKLEAELQKEKEKLKEQYQKELEAYREELSGLSAGMDRFSALFNKLLAGEG